MSEIIDLKVEQPKKKSRQQKAWESLGVAWGADTLTILNREERFDTIGENVPRQRIKGKKGYVLKWKGKHISFEVLSDGAGTHKTPQLVFSNGRVYGEDIKVLGKAIWALEEIEFEPNKYHHGGFWSVFDD